MQNDGYNITNFFVDFTRKTYTTKADIIDLFSLDYIELGQCQDDVIKNNELITFYRKYDHDHIRPIEKIKDLDQLVQDLDRLTTKYPHYICDPSMVTIDTEIKMWAQTHQQVAKHLYSQLVTLLTTLIDDLINGNINNDFYNLHINFEDYDLYDDEAIIQIVTNLLDRKGIGVLQYDLACADDKILINDQLLVHYYDGTFDDTHVPKQLKELQEDMIAQYQKLLAL